MITWMQRHKKWLVITIWISTIAFVGAGFVGWGSYDYSQSSSSAGMVGNKEIKIKDIQTQYNNLYSQYQKMFGDIFNQEMAKKLNLEQAAFNLVAQKYLLLNYADELGLYTTNEEVAKYLVTIPAFIKDNKFNKDIYMQVLKQNRTNPTEFEKQIKDDLLVEKIKLILNSTVTNKEFENIISLYKLEDKVSINIIQKNTLKIDSSKELIEKYWEKNKNNYKSNKTTKISITKVSISTDRKASKKDALKKYLKLKKDELKFDEEILVSKNDTNISKQNLEIILKAPIGKVLKPLDDGKNFIITKILKINEPKTLSFNDAFNKVSFDYVSDERNNKLKQKIKSLMSDFKGQDIGYISQNSKIKIDSLSEQDIANLINHISNSVKNINSITLNDKAIVYKITDSKLQQNANVQTQQLKSYISNIKNNEIISNLLKQLENKYTIQSNMRTN
jgi:peptidyl-prolyl cis-trans isomerase D